MWEGYLARRVFFSFYFEKDIWRVNGGAGGRRIFSTKAFDIATPAGPSLVMVVRTPARGALGRTSRARAIQASTTIGDSSGSPNSRRRGAPRPEWACSRPLCTQ